MMKQLALAAAGLLLAGAPACADDIEYRAVEAVQKLGGTVTRDETDPAHPVIGVNLVGAMRATDSALLDVALLKDLKRLSLFACLGVSEKGVRFVATLKNLQGCAGAHESAPALPDERSIGWGAEAEKG